MSSGFGRVLVYVVLAGVISVGIVCVIVGVILVVESNDSLSAHKPAATQSYFSAEAKRIGLEDLLLKVRDRYFELYPSRIAFKPGVTKEEVKRLYKPFDPKPERIKKTTDEAKKLMKELETLKVSDKLTLYEQRAIDQAKYWVRHVLPYGIPYQYNYYAGAWMLGPDIFCWTPLCSAATFELSTALKVLKPVTVHDLELIKLKLQQAGQAFLTEVDNMKLGVAAGMVRNVEACKSGLETIQTQFRAIAVDGPKGAVNITIAKNVISDGYVSGMKSSAVSSWKSKYGKSPKDSLAEYFIEYIGKPAQQMLRYLEFEHSKHCVSSDISSGLGSLPLKYSYTNSNPVNRSTGRLPSGEPILPGKETYNNYLHYFSSTDASPDELYNIGKEMVDRLYPELIKQAKEMTGESDEENAKRAVIQELDKQSNYFNDQPIPARESNQEAHAKCITMETAKIHCPVRWRAMNKYFSYVREMATLLGYKILPLFHFVGRMISVPTCPVEPTANFNPAAPAAAYYEGDPNCTTTAQYYIPFFLDKIGPISGEWSVSAHEMVPGHHLQVII